MLCLAFMATAASARQVTEFEVSDAAAAPPAQAAQQGPISLEEATRIAQRQYKGRVVRAETKTRNGRRVHEIRILGDDGRVRTVRIDAQGGGSP